MAEGGGRESPGGRPPCARASPKGNHQRKATLQAVLRFVGQLRCSRPAGSRSNCSTALRSDNRESLIRWPLCSSAHPEGNPGTNIPTGIYLGHCCARPWLVRRRAPAPQAERSNGPCQGFQPPSGCLRHGLRVAGVPTRPLRPLTRRGYPDKRRRRAVSSTAHPGTPTQELPAGDCGGAAIGASLSVAHKKEVARRATPRPRLSQDSANYQTIAVSACYINPKALKPPAAQSLLERPRHRRRQVRQRAQQPGQYLRLAPLSDSGTSA